MQKNLVVQLARFGDILQTRRLIKTLQLEGEVVLCVDKSQEKLACLAYPDIEIVPIHAFNASADLVFLENRKAFEYLHSQIFSSVYMLNHSSLSYALAKLFKPEQLKGYILKDGQELRSNWVRLAFKYMRNRFHSPLHIVDYWAHLADNPISPELVNPSAYDKMLNWQHALLGDDEKNQQGKIFQIALVLAGQNRRRSIPVEKYAQVIKVLASRFPKIEFLLLGTKNEEPLAREFLLSTKEQGNFTIKNMVAQTNMEELFALIKECDLVVSPDTGTLHCAAFLGVPTLSFFFSSAWCFETGAYGLGHTCIQIMPTCAPCAERTVCHHLKCHEVFSSPALLARLANKKTQKEIIDFSILESSFDEVGLRYELKEGVLQERKDAEILRSLLYEYRSGKPLMIHDETVSKIANNLFESMDFFPQNLP